MTIYEITTPTTKLGGLVMTKRKRHCDPVLLSKMRVFSQFSLADSLFAKNHYDLAQIEYKREFLFYPELKTNQGKRLNFGISLIKSDDLKGLREFNNIINDFPDLEPEVKVKMAKCYLDLGNFYQACDLLNQTDENMRFIKSN
jgi:hypothetical protein